MKVKQTTRILAIALAILLTVTLTVGIIHIVSRQEQGRIDDLRNEALEMLDAYEGEYDNTRIVLTETTHSEAKQLAELFGAKLRITANGRFAVLTLPDGVTIKDIYSDTANGKYIEAMSPDFYAAASEGEEEELPELPVPARPNYTVSDSGYAAQTYFDYMNIGTAWNEYRGYGVTVAVIDTGIDTDHPEFAGRISEYSYNATEDKIVKDYLLEDGAYDWSLVEDEQGHGTAVAGVIGAAMNGEGTVGIAPEVEIIVIKAECDASGGFIRSSDLVFGLYYAIERDADIVNMSFSSYDPNNIFADATRLAVDSDIICVAAAGNDATAQLAYPAADPNVIGVGALAESSWELASYSNYGENVDIVAPGTTYTSAMNGGYKTINGTSFACPNVVGGLALYLSKNQYTTFDELTEELYASALDLGDLGPDFYYGYGAFDLSAILLEERGTVTFNMLTDELDDIEALFVRYHTLQNIPEPERLYSVFDGWYYDIDCTEPLSLYRDEFSADLTLYAKWVNEDDGVPYTYVELDDGTIEIRSYTGHRRYITIPEYIDGKPVTSIGEDAFAGETRLREVDLPQQLSKIRDRAFKGCSNLVIMNVPSGVTYIGKEAFADNIRLSAVVFTADSRLETVGEFAFKNCSSIRRFEIPETVTSLNGSAFFGASGILQFNVGSGSASFVTKDGVLLNRPEAEIIAYPAGRAGSYSIPDGVTKIGDYSFAFSKLPTIDLDGVEAVGAYGFAYSRLESLTVPDSVTSIGAASFTYNSYLTTLTLGKSLKTVTTGAFSDCPLLKEIAVPAGLESIGMDAFSGSSGLERLVFEENSTLLSIACRAFAYSGISAVEFPASLIQIGSEAFMASGIRTVNFAEGSRLQLIDDGAFDKCRALSEFEFPSGIYSIGTYAFRGTSLTEVSLSATLMSLGAGAFADCDSLENIFIDDACETYIAIDGVVYTADKKIIAAYPAGNTRTEYSIDPSVESIGAAAFYGSDNITNIYISEGLITVGEYGFYNCTAVTTYLLPESLEYINAYAFSENTSLGYISIPDNVYQISNYAFAYDYNLTSIYFTDNAKLPRISYAAFAYTGIYSMRIPASVSTMAQNAFIGSRNLASLTFSSGSKLESISAYMLKGAEQLTSITFEPGSSLKSIEAHGFEGMKALQNVDLGDAKLENIDNYAFRFCESLSTLHIPDGVTYIGRYAFYGCKSLTRLDIPASIDYIGENAFYLAESLDIYFAANTLPASLCANWDNGIRGYYVGVENVVETDEWRYAELTGGGISLVEYLGNDTSLDLGSLGFGDIVNIGGYAFYGKPIETIILPEGLKEIHRYAFAHTALSEITIPDTVTFIGQYAFLFSDIESVNIGDLSSLKTIEQYAFTGTDKLTSFKVPASLKTLDRYAFSKSGLTFIDFSASTLDTLAEGLFMETRLAEVALPDSLTLIGDSAFRGIPSLKRVTFGAGELVLQSNVFYNTGLTELYIPDNLTYIGEYSLVGLEGLTAFEVSATHPRYTAIDGLLYSKDGKKLIAAPAGRTGEISLPESLEILGFGAFENSKLTKINFHPSSNILTFGYRCFYNSAITELNVPASVVSFDYYAFAMCKSLTSVTFAEDNNLKGIYEGTFYGCINLSNIVIPDSIVEISDYAFYGCTSLDKLPISETSEIKGIYDYAFAYSRYDELTLPETLIDIGNYAFRGSSFKRVTVPDGNKELLVIGIGAFQDCNALEEITLPFIGASFEDMDITWFGYIFGAGGYEANGTYIPKSIKNVNITEGLQRIGNRAFSNIGAPIFLDLPDSISVIAIGSIGDNIICELKNPIELTLDRSNNGSNVIVGNGVYGTLNIIGEFTEFNYSLNSATSLNAIILPEGIVRIFDGAFFGCGSLSYIELPSTLEYIESNAFGSCFNLTEIYNKSNIKLTIGEQYENGGIAYKAHLITDKDGNKNYIDGVTSIEYLSTPDGFKFRVENGEYTLIGYAGQEYTVTLPDNVLGNKYSINRLNGIGHVIIPEGITELSDSAFKISAIEEVTLPHSIERIGEDAFAYCAHLKTVNFADGGSLKNIGAGAFSSCVKLETIDLPATVAEIGYTAFSYCTNLKTVTFGQGCQMTAIGDQAFSECISLTEIDLPSGLSYIEYGMFRGCEKLSRVSIPEGVWYIREEAFEGCKSLKSIELPDSMSNIKSAFSGSGIEEVIISEGNTHLTVEKDAIYNYDKSKIYHIFDNVKTFTVPNTVIDFSFENNTSIESIYFEDGSTITVIPQTAFNSCTNLKYIELPATVTSIETCAFMNTHSLSEIYLPDSISNISQWAFGGSGLKSLTIPKGLKTVGKEAFSDIQNLLTLVIPETVELIEDEAFVRTNIQTIINASELELTFGSTEHGRVAETATIIVDKNGNRTVNSIYLEEPYSLTEDNFLFEKADNGYRLIAYLGDEETVTLPRDYMGMPYEMYYIRGVTNVIIPEGITSVSTYAFRECITLRNVLLPSGITNIGPQAFLYCINLESINIPDGTLYIGMDAFWLCESLYNINIPDTVTQIGPDAFLGTDYYNDEANWENGCLYINKHLISVDPNFESFVVREGTVSIAKDAFDGCYTLKSVTLGCDAVGVLIPITNLETLIFTSSPSHPVRDYFMDGNPHPYDVPLTLKTIILKDEFTVNSSKLLNGISGVTVIVESEKTAVQWDHDFPGWNNGNRVYYAGEWINAEFFDEDGSLIDHSYYSVSSIVRQPYVGNKIDGDVIKVFVGWDIDGDGIVDTIPATSKTDIKATAVFSEHRVGGYETVTPTCTENGYKQLVCLDCGEIIERIVIRAVGHTSSGLIEAVDPTCDQDGYELHSCVNCSEEYKIITEPALGHTYGEWTTELSPTCKESGSRYHICSVCQHREEVVVDKINHIYSQAMTKEPTCEREGEITYSCDNCEYKFTSTVEKLPHTYEKKYASKSFIRWLIELVLNILCGYEGDDAFYYQCAECGRFMTVEEGNGAASSGTTVAGAGCEHELGEWTVNKAESCTDVGIEVRECLKCNTVIEARTFGSPMGHDMHSLEDKAPTCTEDGYKDYQYCTSCDYKLFTVIPALGHTEVIDPAKAPTCTETGLTEGKHCSVCGETLIAQELIGALGHTEVVDPAKTPTCTETGLTVGKHCSVCGETLVVQEVVPALGHELVAHPAKAPTCTEVGNESYDTCSNCDYSTIVVLPMIPHSLEHFDAKEPTCTEIGWNEYDACTSCDYSTRVELRPNGHIITYYYPKDPTCTEAGWTVYNICEICNTVFNYDELPAIGHDLIYIEGKIPTCLEFGHNAYEFCSRCDHTTYEELPALGHDLIYVEGKIPTCLEVGHNAYEFCSRCDHTTYEELPALGHDLVYHEAQAPSCESIGWNAYYTCSRCDHTTYEELPALGHNIVHHESQKQGCESIGWSAYDTCSRCDYTTYMELPALGHNIVHHEAQKQCCESIGWSAYYTCLRCDHTTYEELPALGHDLVYHEAQAPSCESIGWNAYYTCSRCDHTTYEELPALGHDLVYHEAQASSCESVGWNAYYTCSRCDHTTYEELPATGHNYNEFESDEDSHSRKCGACGKVEEGEAHDFEDGICTVCKREEARKGFFAKIGEWFKRIFEWIANLFGGKKKK